jgi:hypothetical protein
MSFFIKNAISVLYQQSRKLLIDFQLSWVDLRTANARVTFHLITLFIIFNCSFGFEYWFPLIRNQAENYISPYLDGISP